MIRAVNLARYLAFIIYHSSFIVCVLAAQAPQQDTRSYSNPAEFCQSDQASTKPSRSLYCIDLVAVPDFPDATGTIELGRARSPFGAAVSRNGNQLYDLTITLAGLPEPQSLGGYSAYVAWVTTPTFEITVKLGVVRNGRTPLPQVAFNKFIVMVTAEATGEAATRQGRMILRGNSPSSLMLPHNVVSLPPRTGDSHQHAKDSTGWTMPPMHPGVSQMIPGLEPLRPGVTPWLPKSAPPTSPTSPTSAVSIPIARPRRVIEMSDGDTLDLEAVVVRRSIAGRDIVMYGFNGQYPGPLITVKQNALIVVNFTNRLDEPTTVHWHGVRLDNRFDGVPHITQDPVPPGGKFRYTVRFPDAGIYWYHPHHREDIQQDLGLYGNLLVRSAVPGFLGPTNREVVLMLDDILLTGDELVPFGRESATHALMGRFGNVFLLNGEPDYQLHVKRGEVVRFFLTNASNTRPYNVSFGDARMKVVASDVSKFEREEWVESVVIAPAERYVVDVRFDRAGSEAIVNQVQAIDHTLGRFFPEVDTLGKVIVSRDVARPDHAQAFARLRHNADITTDIGKYRQHFDRAPDRELVLTLRAKNLPFPLVQVLRLDTGYVNPVEWSGTMPMMDWLATGEGAEWILREPSTGLENMRIDWRFHRGDVIKIRLANDRHTLHSMQHPIHIHGQRFLVLAQNGVSNDNLVWKDTVLLPAGSTADILLELSNPGRWMLHCHIAEHLETGMHMVFEVK